MVLPFLPTCSAMSLTLLLTVSFPVAASLQFHQTPPNQCPAEFRHALKKIIYVGLTLQNNSTAVPMLITHQTLKMYWECESWLHAFLTSGLDMDKRLNSCRPIHHTCVCLWSPRAAAYVYPASSRKFRFPNFVTTAQDGGKVVSLHPQEILLVLISLRG